jgi:hypothetical protein
MSASPPLRGLSFAIRTEWGARPGRLIGHNYCAAPGILATQCGSLQKAATLQLVWDEKENQFFPAQE